jgi:YegS/Rv2252/BmrU family lipid kinase
MTRLVVSGKVAARRDLAEAIGEVILAGYPFDVRVSTAERSAVAWAEEAARDGHERIVAVGGDGTLHEVVVGARGAAVVGLVPCGTANDFAGLFEARSLAEWLRAALEAEPVRLDLGLADDVPFVNMATIGVPAEISADTQRDLKDALGKLAYTASALGSLAAVQPVPLEVRAPGLSFAGDALAVCVANGRQAGGGFVLAPEASLDDGLLDVVIVPAMGLAGAGVVASGALLGGVDLDGRVERARVPWVEVNVPAGADPVAVSLDGEVERRHRVRFTVQPRALAFAAPPLR